MQRVNVQRVNMQRVNVQSVKQTRRERRESIDRVRLYRPFVFYAAVLALMHAAVLKAGAPSLTTCAALFAGGLLTWGLYEYAVHRWVLHREPRPRGFNLPGNLTHLRHHADPNALERLNVQLNESVPVCVVYLLLARAATGDWPSAVYLYTGLMAGYFFYEYLDYQAHHGAARGHLVRYFRRNHLLHHHHDATVRYGVTSPLFDLLFGTYRLPKRLGRAGREGGEAHALGRAA